MIPLILSKYVELKEQFNDTTTFIQIGANDLEVNIRRTHDELQKNLFRNESSKNEI